MYVPPIALLSILLLSRVVPAVDAVVVVGIWVLYLSTVSAAANYLCQRYKSLAYPIYLFSLFLLALSGPLTFVSGIGVHLNSVDSLKWAILATVTSAIFMPAFSSGSGISAHRSAVLEELRASINQAEVRSIAISSQRQIINKQISTYLHGTVQANMSAAILRLQNAIELGDRDGATQALLDAREALNLKWDASLGTTIEDLNTELHDIKNGWLGLVDISIDLKPDIPKSLNSKIRDIVIDAINNAVRHGEAEVIDIRIHPVVDGVEIVIANNGHILEKIRTGLGTEVLNSYALGKWNRTVLPDGRIELRVTLNG